MDQDTSNGYDSREDTLKHRKRVKELLAEAVFNLTMRGGAHDESKLSEPEKMAFDEFTPKLKECVFGGDDYKKYLNHPRFQAALKHHYASNRHHPEHFDFGIKQMTLLDLLEMLCDWKASSERMKDGGDILKSIDINERRFEINSGVAKILRKTVYALGWAAWPLAEPPQIDNEEE